MIEEVIKKFIHCGDVLYTPTGAMKIIQEINETFIIYRHGNSNVRFYMKDIDLAYENFKGKRVSTTDLKDLNPKVFVVILVDIAAMPLFFLFLWINVILLRMESKARVLEGIHFLLYCNKS